MKKFIGKLALYIAAFLVVANGMGWIGDYALRRSQFFKPSFLINNFNPAKKFDYVIMGSSRGLTTLNTIDIDSTLGTYGANLSMDATGIKTHIAMLQHFFAQGYGTNLLVLNVDTPDFVTSPTGISDNDYKLSPFIAEPYLKKHFFLYEHHPLKPNYVSQYFPFIKYSYYNLQIVPSAIRALFQPQARHRFDQWGNFSYPDNPRKVEKTVNTKVMDCSLDNPYLKQIQHICNSNGTNLVIYIAPYLNKKISMSTEYTLINHSDLLEDKRLFYDEKHVNRLGRKQATSQFIGNLTKLLGLNG